MNESKSKYENMNIFSNYQFSCGDQSIEGREKFAISNFTICPKCDSTEFTKDHDIANGRMNGDCYGTDVFICKSCNWITSFQWDEAGDSEYYYEIEHFDYYEEYEKKIKEQIKKAREEREERNRQKKEEKINI